MIGIRKFVDESGELNAHKFVPGSYGYDPIVDMWYAMSPNGHLACLGSHKVIEHDDGTITVHPSIAINNAPNSQVYHGWLENGVWRDA